MPDDGWSEPWPRRDTDEHGAWDQFVASLDAAELERERMRVLGDLSAERWGSRQHHENVHAHEYMAEQLRRDREAIAAAVRRDGLTPDLAALRVVAHRRENQHDTHTNGTAA